MTFGIDVSFLFSEIVLYIDTNDVTMKKMVYLYLVKHAQADQNLAMVCIDALLNDWYVYSTFRSTVVTRS